MEKATYIQIDRMEDKINKIAHGQGLLMNLESLDVLQSFYEEEVLSDEGELRHLKSDKKVKDFFENLIKEAEEDEPEDEEGSEEDKGEYRNKKFKE